MIKVWVTRWEESTTSPPFNPPLTKAKGRKWGVEEGRERGLAHELRLLGLDPLVEPVLQIEILTDARLEVTALDADDWLVLTSPLAIRHVCRPTGIGPCVAVVGTSSANLARSLGFNVQLISPTVDARGLWEALAPLAKNKRICFPRSALATVPTIDGVNIQAPILYDVRPRDFDSTVASQAQIVTFTSPSAVSSVLTKLKKLSLPAVSIGPTTSQALRSAGVQSITEAEERTLPALALAARKAASRLTI